MSARGRRRIGLQTTSAPASRSEGMHRRTLLLLVVALAVTTVASTMAAAATPRYKTAVGIGDQSAAMFTNPSFKALKVKKVRYFIPWDAAKHKDQLAKADSYVFQAK